MDLLPARELTVIATVLPVAGSRV